MMFSKIRKQIYHSFQPLKIVFESKNIAFELNGERLMDEKITAI
jgi:hypothetical protein